MSSVPAHVPAPLFNRPLGPSKNGPYNKFWNVSRMGADGPLTCQLCGTEHPENRGEAYGLFYFLGYQGVEECCGAFLDEMYTIGALQFATAYLHEYAKDPGSPGFYTLRGVLKETLEAAKKHARTVAEEVDQMATLAPE